MDPHGDLLVGIDLGTSSVKVAVLTVQGTVHREASAAYAVTAPQPGWAESTPAHWWRATRTAVREAAAGAARIVGVGLTGQMHGVVLTAASGEPLRPAVLWPDTRTGDQLRRYTALGASALTQFANPVVTGMAGPTLLWLREHEPDVYAAARWALQPKDWLRMQLTGAAAADPTDASATLLYDLPADDWAWSLVEHLDLRSELLAPVMASADPAGRLRAEAASELGLPAGVPVAVGAGDAAAAALGTGLLEPGPVQVTIGTGAQVLAPLGSPIADPTRRTHTYRAAAPQRW